MHLRTLPLSNLKAAPYNPRRPLSPDSAGYRRLARSLDEFELVQPIVWNERTGHIVSGHQRVAILRDRGVTEVDCVVVDLPLAQEKMLNVALNNPAVGSDWDDPKLHDLLVELTELPDIDATLTGFDPDELNDLLLAPAEPLLPEPPADSNAVQVILLVPPHQWESLRPALDELLATHEVEMHVRRA